jgi:hypothetical protein
MAQSYRKPALRVPADADRQILAKAMENLVERGLISAEVINAELETLISNTKQAALKASEINQEKVISAEQTEKLLSTLELRFHANKQRHKDIEWSQVASILKNAEISKLWSLNEMEKTGGEPDVVKIDEKTGEVVFYDCSKESPVGRRDCVYDREGEEYLKKHYPNEKYNENAVDMMEKMGLDFLDEQEYRFLQTLGDFDINSWSWIKTPIDKRKKGVALYGVRDVFGVDICKNNPSSHIDYRGVRAVLRV